MSFSRVLESPNAKQCAKNARISGIFKVPKLLKLIFIYLENIYWLRELDEAVQFCFYVLAFVHICQ